MFEEERLEELKTSSERVKRNKSTNHPPVSPQQQQHVRSTTSTPRKDGRITSDRQAMRDQVQKDISFRANERRGRQSPHLQGGDEQRDRALRGVPRPYYLTGDLSEISTPSNFGQTLKPRNLTAAFAGDNSSVAHGARNGSHVWFPVVDMFAVSTEDISIEKQPRR